MFDVSKYLEAVKLSPKYLTPVVSVSGFLLLAKPEILGVLGLAELSAKYRPYIGGIFLLSTALVLSHWLISLYSWFADRRLWSGRIKRSTIRLHKLTSEEKKILREGIGRNTRTQYFRLENGVASGLELEHIILGHLIPAT